MCRAQLLGALFLIALIVCQNPPALAVPIPYPAGLAVNSSTGRLYVANGGGANTVSVVNTESERVIKTIQVGSGPVRVAVNGKTNRIYVVNGSSDSVWVIDGATNTVVAHIPVGRQPFGVGVNENTNRIYVANRADASISVIDGATDTVIKTISTSGGVPMGVGINPATNKIYVPNANNRTVTVIRGDVDNVEAHVEVLDVAYEAGVNPVTNRIYVSIQGAGDVIAVMDGATNAVIKNIPVGLEPWMVGVERDLNLIYVANRGHDTISFIEGVNNTVMATRAVGDGPVGVAVDSVRDKTLIGNSLSQNISVLYGGELLKNQSFDGDGNGDGLPNSWRGRNLDPTDRLNLTAFDGKYAFRLGGQVAVRKELRQTVAISGPAGTELLLRGWSKATSVPSSGGLYALRTTLAYKDGSQERFLLEFARGTHDYELETTTIVAQKVFSKAIVSALFFDQPNFSEVLFDGLHFIKK